MTSERGSALATKIEAWLVTGPLGRGVAFGIDFAVALRTMLARRHR